MTKGSKRSCGVAPIYACCVLSATPDPEPHHRANPRVAPSHRQLDMLGRNHVFLALFIISNWWML